MRWNTVARAELEFGEGSGLLPQGHCAWQALTEHINFESWGEIHFGAWGGVFVIKRANDKEDTEESEVEVEVEVEVIN